MPAGDTCSGQGVRPCHFIDPGFCQPAFVTPCASLCHFIGHAGGQTLSFYRPQLLPEQACIEAIHVACLVAQFIYIYIHMKPAGVSHRLMQKEARGISEAKQARGKT